MGHGDFVWCDLSARQIDRVCPYYTRVFGWTYYDDKATDGTLYRLAHCADRAVAGLYTMPEKFQQMAMPCFWMSYIHVQSADDTVEQAKSHGGIVEFGPADGGLGTRVALIRDPLGAGFTVIEGPGMTPRSDHPTHGEPAWNELYVSDAQAVIPFYETLFGWSITASHETPACFDVFVDGRKISRIWHLDDSVRGKEQYWAVHFAVDELATARAHICEGGSILSAQRDQILARDPDGAAFFVKPVGGSP